jgi:hypothetical protein
MFRRDAVERVEYDGIHVHLHLKRLSGVKMQTTDTDLLFQTNQQLDATAQRKLKIVAAEDVGSPVTMSSKILDVQVIWPNAWTAESGWLARHLDLEVSHS